jgi:phosphoserine aminotransferase
MTRVYNFGAGPAMLPESLLEEVQGELLDWQQSGMSILEIGHRTSAFTRLMEETEESLRELLDIPSDYHVLFLTSVARMQFAMIPMNFLEAGEEAGYLITGLWSSLAYQEAQKLKQAYCLSNAEANGFSRVAAADEWELKEKTRYFYYTPNETVNGLRFPKFPALSKTPLIADMTSCLLTEPLNIRNYALIFAGAQKNIANAGLTIVIASDEFINSIRNENLPTLLDYRTYSKTRSTYATLPTFNCYLAGKMFQWIKQQGGVEHLFKQNCQKSALLYDCIDRSSFYHGQVDKAYRSLVNVCFRLEDPSLEDRFLEAAQARGLYSLKGHRAVGGLRASIYNAMPLAGVESLVEFMNDFARESI